MRRKLVWGQLSKNWSSLLLPKHFDCNSSKFTQCLKLVLFKARLLRNESPAIGNCHKDSSISRKIDDCLPVSKSQSKASKRFSSFRSEPIMCEHMPQPLTLDRLAGMAFCNNFVQLRPAFYRISGSASVRRFVFWPTLRTWKNPRPHYPFCCDWIADKRD